MNGSKSAPPDPAAISAFVASLSNLPREEIQKAKKLFILNAIADFEAQRTTAKTMLIVLGLMSLIPIFLVIFIPALIGYRSGMKAGKQKILNAIEVWKDDLGSDYHDFAREDQQLMTGRILDGRVYDEISERSEQMRRYF